MTDETGEVGRIVNQVDKNREAVSDLRLEFGVMRTHFDYAPKHEDIEQAEKRVMTAFRLELKHISDDLRAANREQSKDLAAEFRKQREADNQRRAAEQLADREAIINAVSQRRAKLGWWIMGIVGGLVVTAIGTVAGILITRAMTGG